MKPVALILIVFYWTSCSEPAKEKQISTQSSQVLKITDSISVVIDSVGVFDSEDYHYFEENGNAYFSVLDDRRRIFFIYSWPELQLFKKFSIPDEGPNGIMHISPSYFGSYQKNLDSIWFWNFNTSTFYLYDSNGKKIKEFYWDLDKYKMTSNPFVNCTNPMFIDSKGSYIVSIQNSFRVRNSKFSQTPSLARFSIKGDSLYNLRLLVNYPEIYNKGWYGLEPFLYLVSFSWNENLKAYLVSFPADSHVYVYNKDFRFLHKREIPSNYIDRVKPFRNEKFLKDLASNKTDVPDVQDRGKYLHETSYYGRLFRFDSLNLNGRLCYLNEEGKNYPTFSFIVFDDNFNVLGEQKIDGREHLFSWFFQVGNTIYAINEKKTYSKTNEDKLFFDGFRVALEKE
jgi:hypothetical protein